MIRIHRCIPRQQQSRPVAVQTDQPLPKIRGYGHKYEARRMKAEMAVHRSCGDGGSSDQENMQYDGGDERKPFSTFHERNQPLKSKLTDKGEKQQCLHSPKIEAKCFKFLRFQENILRLGLSKYLAGIPLSKEQSKKLNQKIILTYLPRQIASLDCSSSSPINSRIQIDGSDSSQMRVTIRQVVDQLRNLHEQLAEIGDNNPYLSMERKRKICKMIETLIKQSKNLQMTILVTKDSDDKVKLKLYLQKYSDEFEKNQPLQKDQNKTLMTFYQTIFNRYEEVPFNDQFNTTPIHISQIFSSSDKSRQKLTKKESLAVVTNGGKETENLDQSFIKLRFYNNLRLEVKNLTEDTEKIINAQMNKLSQI